MFDDIKNKSLVSIEVRKSEKTKAVKFDGIIDKNKWTVAENQVDITAENMFVPPVSLFHRLKH